MKDNAENNKLWKYVLAWHENGGNEFFRIPQEMWLTLKAKSDSQQAHNFMLVSPIGTNRFPKLKKDESVWKG